MTSSQAFSRFERAQSGNRPSLAACSVDIHAAPLLCFDLFTKEIGKWWPVGRAAGTTARREIVMEPRVNGAFFEVGPRGLKEEWGTVVAFVPARTIIIDWKLDLQFVPSPTLTSELEVFFAQNRDGSSHLTIIHTRLEALGSAGQDIADRVTAQWRDILNSFQRFSKLMSTEPGRDTVLRRNSDKPAGLY